MAVVGFRLGWKQAVASPACPCALMFQKAISDLCNFKVTKRAPLLVTPNSPTPTHPLYLINMDDQLGLRIHVAVLLFYRSPCYSSTMKNVDPVRIIEEALAKLLVHYYPFAGRLRDADDKGKLIVDCTGEGALFVEADADISMEDFGVLSPQIPRALDFINNVPWPDTITDSPLLLIQVTRLRCGGFILGLGFNHCVTDAVGLAQFLKAFGEIARGAASPTVPPVWEREILRPRQKPAADYPGVREYYDFEKKYRESIVQVPQVPEEMKSKSFYFGSKEIAALKREAEGVKHSTPFEIISACLWRSRTKALDIPGDQDSTFLFIFNARSRFYPPLPTGYYGNVILPAYARTKSRDLTRQPLSFALKLIKEGKRRVEELEYLRSFIDLAELNGCPHYLPDDSYAISDVSKIMLDMAEADFGWGKAAYAFPVYPPLPLPTFSCLIRPSVKAFEGFLAPVCLPSKAMEIFEQDINSAINNGLKT